MNELQKENLKLAKAYMKADGLGFRQAKKKARQMRRSISEMLVKKYGFPRK